MPKINLYISPGSCSLAAHILLREAGLAFKLTSVSVRNGFPSQYLHVNPKGRVPILQLDEDTIITEVPAILTAISQLVPERKLLGGSDLEVVRSYEWMNYLSGTLHGQGYGGLFRPGRFINDESMFEAIQSKGRQTIQECYQTIEEKLMNRVFTAVDAYLLVFYRWGNRNGFGMREKYPRYTGLVERMAERESVKKAVEVEGIELFSD